ncbi:hypothetical protein ACFLYU_05800, partial [Candidatus Dependentiae bacterium]
NLTICRMLIPYCKKTINMLAQKMRNQEENEEPITPLYCAYVARNLTLCKLLILNGAKIMRKNSYKISKSCMKDYEKIIKQNFMGMNKRLKKHILTINRIKLTKTFDEAKSDSQKIKIIEKNKNDKSAYKFLLKLAFSRFLLENIENKKNICEMFFYKALINPKHSTEIEKEISKYKKYILRLDMRRIAKKIYTQYKLFQNNLNKLRNPKHTNNKRIKPDLLVKCQHY